MKQQDKMEEGGQNPRASSPSSFEWYDP
eukprot:COSAG02_NODE_67245_length_252_cov_0.805195_1_plen_27_part_01